jgi:prepilin-type N-terminal cleavage/methylation domain-containing protein
MVRRKGFTIVEMVVALFVLGVAMALTARMLSASGRQRDALESQTIALIEAGNLMESIAAEEWEAITPNLAASLVLSSAAVQNLTDPRWEIDVRQATEPVAKRVTIRLHWGDRTGQPNPPVRLTAWMYPPANSSTNRGR